MNILMYNWCQFDDAQRRGGGVSVYLKNIIPAVLERGDKVVFLSSGHRYSLFSRMPKVNQTGNIFQSKSVKSFELHNSPVKAPAHDAFGSIEQALSSPQLDKIFVDIVKEHKIDEIHFHGIEGISTGVLAALKAQTNVSIKVWLHNYHWICPQIELFSRASDRCVDYAGGKNCVNCLSHIGHMPTLKKYQALGDLLANIGLANKPLGHLIFGLVNHGFQLVKVVLRFFRALLKRKSIESALGWRERSSIQTSMIHKAANSASMFQKWRIDNVALLNEVVDQIYAVSDIVREQYEARGVSKGKIKVTPIGMPDDNFDDSFQVEKASSGKLRIGFLGYAIPSKGLGFLCDAISDLADQCGDKFSLFVVSSLSPTLKRDLSMLSEKIDLAVLEGYERSELGEILSQIDLLVVPSLWWETYNQVTYESVRARTPVLLSDTVGISMLIKNKDFLFRSGDKQDLVKTLLKFINDPSELESFWKHEPELPSFDDHMKMLS